MEDEVKEAANAALVETADAEEVLGVDVEDDEVAALGWEYGLGLSTVATVNTD